MHGNLYRISVHQRLDTLGLVSICQLVCGVNVDFDLSAGCFFHELAELASALCPGTGFGGRAGEVPCLLRPVKIAVICDIIVIFAVSIIPAGTGLAVISRRIGIRGSSYRTAVGTIFSSKCFWKERGNLRNVGDQQKYSNGCSDHRHNGL